MNRIGRYILNGLTVLSLLLCVTTVGLWVRSYFVFDAVNYVSWDFFYPARVTSLHGHFAFVTLDMQVQPDTRGWSYENKRANTNEISDFLLLTDFFKLTRNLRIGIFKWLSGEIRDGKTVGASVLVIPHATMTATFAVFPLTWLIKLIRTRRRARVRSGNCLECGYDLRATPDRCPECGTVPKRANA